MRKVFAIIATGIVMIPISFGFVFLWGLYRLMSGGSVADLRRSGVLGQVVVWIWFVGIPILILGYIAYLIFKKLSSLKKSK